MKMALVVPKETEGKKGLKDVKLVPGSQFAYYASKAEFLWDIPYLTRNTYLSMSLLDLK